jgi:hypothetical protein
MRLTPAKKATHVVIFVVVTVVQTALSMWLGLGPVVWSP